jgi:zinc-ribbon domain
MAGGVAQDALSEIDVVKKIGDRLEAPTPQVKIRCQKCQALNDPTAKFCSQCGTAI